MAENVILDILFDALRIALIGFTTAVVGVLSWVVWGKSLVHKRGQQIESIRQELGAVNSAMADNQETLEQLTIMYKQVADYIESPYQLNTTSLTAKLKLPQEPDNDYELTDYAGDYDTVLDNMVLWTIATQLNGRCAYRLVLKHLEPYNESAKKTGLRKLIISERRIKNVINKMTFNPLVGGPIIQLTKDSPKKNYYGDFISSNNLVDNYIIVTATSQGGHTRAMISLGSIFNEDKPLVSVVNNVTSVSKLSLSAAYQAISEGKAAVSDDKKR